MDRGEFTNFRIKALIIINSVYERGSGINCRRWAGHAENIAMHLNNHNFIISGIAYDNEEARKQLLHNTPDAVLMDINLRSYEDGIDLARFINKNYKIPFLFLTSYADKKTIDRAKEVEPSAYIFKTILFYEKYPKG